jgi:uncharacterized damage-inducible protein DinB
MSLAEIMFSEFETQAPVTRKFLERLPEEKLTWKPHEKSMTAGQLAYHLAFVPGGVIRAVQQNPAQAPDFTKPFPQPEKLEDVLKTLEESIAMVKNVLPQITDASMQETWRLVSSDQELLAMPRGQFLRDIMLNHWYQHRGQFCVYLRLLDVAVPSSWGPSADEQPGFQAKKKSA